MRASGKKPSPEMFVCLTDAVCCLRLCAKRAICLVNVPPCVCVCRSMQKLTQLERLDLGSNEFTEVVRIRLSAGAWGPYQGDLISFVQSHLLVSLFCNNNLSVLSRNIDGTFQRISGGLNGAKQIAPSLSPRQAPPSVSSMPNLFPTLRIHSPRCWSS